MADKYKETLEKVAEKLKNGVKKAALSSAVFLASLTGQAKENVSNVNMDEKIPSQELNIQNENSNEKSNKELSFEFDVYFLRIDV